MALSNQSELPAISVPGRSVKEFISIPAYDKPEWFIPEDDFKDCWFIKSPIEISQIDLLPVTRSW
jgi:hypothetical protein